MCDPILFAHVILGCNTTSHVHGHVISYIEVDGNVILDQLTQVFNTSRSSNKVELVTAGEKALFCQHSGD